MYKYRLKVHDKNLEKDRVIIVKVDPLKGETLESRVPENFIWRYAERIDKKPGLLSRLRRRRK